MRSGLENTNLVANAAAFISFFLLWLAVVWGIILRNGWASTRVRHSSVYGIHRAVALLGLCLGVVHAFAVQAIRGEQVRWIDAVVPFASQISPLNKGFEPYYQDINGAPVNPIGISVAVLGLELLIAAAASLLIQRRLGYNRWRGLHSITYAAFALVVAHIMISGADQGPTWIWASVSGCWLVTIAMWPGAQLWTLLGESRFGRSLPLMKRERAMTVNVNPGKCERAGFCVQMAPTVFRLRSEGRLTYRPSVYPAEVEAVTRAAEVCPVRAISLGMAPTMVVPSLPQVYDDQVGRPRSRAMAGRNHRRES